MEIASHILNLISQFIIFAALGAAHFASRYIKFKERSWYYYFNALLFFAFIIAANLFKLESFEIISQLLLILAPGLWGAEILAAIIFWALMISMMYGIHLIAKNQFSGEANPSKFWAGFK